ncbi:hypothetical protein DHW03_01640 [Pedobacter yonginense]|uniref:Uncharacterized protein n=1 Tax=Pedobacter yonginense TaxID=651869 RepID=A0A317EP32_9SPHI|nr:hypothetical protein DHW03_01640 [Pedobacter yonginense]
MKFLISVLIFIQIATIGQEKKQEVYICVSPTAIAYHKSKTACKGIRSCTHRIQKVTLEDAIKKYKYRACKLCF